MKYFFYIKMNFELFLYFFTKRRLNNLAWSFILWYNCDEFKEEVYIFMENNWRNTPVLHRVIACISILASLAVVVLAALQIFGVWEQAINAYMPLVGVVNLCQTYILWNSSRKVAYFSLGTAVFIFICAIVVFFVN